MSSKKIVIIDYKSGNLYSVSNAFKFLNIDIEITNKINKIKDSIGLVLPGVGAFGDTMKNLDAANIITIIKDEVSKGKPFLGICLGYQVLFEDSEEDKGVEGLKLLKGHVVKFKTKKLKVPQIGWNEVEIVKKSSLYNNVKNKEYFYFVHSYYPVPEDNSIIATKTEYDDIFASSIQVDNIFATQFHPEKSQDTGLSLIKNFGEFCVNNTSN